MTKLALGYDKLKMPKVVTRDHREGQKKIPLKINWLRWGGMQQLVAWGTAIAGCMGLRKSFSILRINCCLIPCKHLQFLRKLMRKNFRT